MYQPHPQSVYSSQPTAPSQQGAVHGSQQPHQQPGNTGSTSFGGRASHTGDPNVPVVSAPPRGSTPITPVYDYYVDGAGQTCKVLRFSQQVPQYKTEYRCSPGSGTLYTTQILVEATETPPARNKLEWRCNPVTGERYQVEIPISHMSPQPSHQTQYPPAANAGHVRQHQHQSVQGQLNTAQLGTSFPAAFPVGQGHLHHQVLGSHGQQHQHQQEGTFSQQLQDKMKGIARLVEGGVTKMPARPIDFAKKCSAKWAKKVTTDSINLPLFTYGAISELEASLSGRSEKLSEGDFLAKLRHVRNFLEVCCLNSEPTDFKGYGWTIAKDYAMKVESGVDQHFTSWGEMSGGVQTDQLVLAQMDFPRPVPVQKKVTLVKESDSKTATTARERCKTYNSCRTEDKCEYELSHPDKKCILKHECSWCKINLKQSYRHQEWSCKKKN